MGSAIVEAALRAFVDTNIPIRHLTGDPPGQARRATAFLARSHVLVLTDVVVAEIVFVLESVYERPAAEVAGLVRSLLALRSIEAPALDLILRALELYELTRLDFADAYLAAAAELSGVSRIASFDRRFDRVPSIERVEP
jgi:predicted nucleic acid-binding protein